MTGDTEPVSPITMDHIDPAMARSQESTEHADVDKTNGGVTKNENSIYDTSRPQHNRSVLSWRSRFAGRTTTINVDELENGSFLLSLFARFVLSISYLNYLMQALLLPMSPSRTEKRTSPLSLKLRCEIYA